MVSRPPPIFPFLSLPSERSAKTSAHLISHSRRPPDQAFYDTTVEEAASTTKGANPAYIGAMASVDSIAEAIAKGLGLEEA